jgi:cytoplasmic iron level regulating protein YaaA (DUF328/UPF0246 family)
MKELIIIPCSGSKNPYGNKSVMGREITKELDTTSKQKLYRLRQMVSNFFDIGLTNGMNPQSGMLKPAYKRYSGNLYNKIAESSWNKIANSKDADLVIVSALYGIIYYDEPIINYNVAMGDNTLGKQKLYTWWKQNQLEDILAEYINTKEYTLVRSFLSGDYKKALPKIESKINAHWLQYQYPNLGSGSNYYRGKDVNNIINNALKFCPKCNSRLTKRISRNEFVCENCNDSYEG